MNVDLGMLKAFEDIVHEDLGPAHVLVLCHYTRAYQVSGADISPPFDPNPQACVEGEQRMRKKHWKASPLPSTQKGLPTRVMPRDGRAFSVPPTVESVASVTQQNPPSQVSTLGKVMKNITAVFCNRLLIYQARCKKILRDLSSPQWEHIVVSCCCS